MSEHSTSSSNLLWIIIVILTVIVIILMIILLGDRVDIINQPVTPTVNPTTTPSQTYTPTPIPTTTPTTTPIPTLIPFEPPVSRESRGNSALRSVVDENGSPEEVVAILQSLEWVSGDLITDRASVLYIYDEAFAETTYTEDFVYDADLVEFSYSAVFTNIYMYTETMNSYCGIRLNSNNDGTSFIEVLLYRNGRFKVEVRENGKLVRSLDEPLLDNPPPLAMDLVPFANLQVFNDRSGLTIIIDYVILSRNIPSSRRIQIDHSPLSSLENPGGMRWRVGTDFGDVTHCRYFNMYQYPLE